MKVTRVLLVGATLAVAGIFYQNPNLLNDIQDVGVMGVVDLTAWGEDYLTGNSTELAMPHDKYRHILEEQELGVIDLSEDDFEIPDMDSKGDDFEPPVIDLSSDDL